MKCDKCHTEVPANNDATIVEAYAFNSPLTVLFNYSRHFLPVYDDRGNMICEGSPSRAQYIDGQPKDTRGYEYNPEYEEAWRRGYEECNKYSPVVSG